MACNKGAISSISPKKLRLKATEFLLDWINIEVRRFRSGSRDRIFEFDILFERVRTCLLRQMLKYHSIMSMK